MQWDLRGLKHRSRDLAAEYVKIFFAEFFEILRLEIILVKGIARHAGEQACIGAETQTCMEALVKCNVYRTKVLAQRMLSLI